MNCSIHKLEANISVCRPSSEPEMFYIFAVHIVYTCVCCLENTYAITVNIISHTYSLISHTHKLSRPGHQLDPSYRPLCFTVSHVHTGGKQIQVKLTLPLYSLSDHEHAS